MLVCCVVGTRPEAIKLGPVIRAIATAPSLSAVVLSSGQHAAETAAVLGAQGVRVDEALPDCSGQGLAEMTASLLGNLQRARSLGEAGVVMVQGDTTTAFAGALAAFHRGVPVAHLEAGLRSGVATVPFPEEAHRRLIAALAAVHLAPTPRAAAHLMREGIPRRAIAITGNTSVDALLSSPYQPDGTPLDGVRPERRLVLVTLHRRESWGEPIRRVCDAIGRLARAEPDMTVVFATHPNPDVRRDVIDRLTGVSNAYLTPPLAHATFARYLRAADVVVTDSGGVQEEAATLGKRTLVVRDVTDRPEAVEAGLAEIVGTDPDRVAAALERAIAAGPIAGSPDVYGDGKAASRVVTALTRWSQQLEPLLPGEMEFLPRSVPLEDALR